MMPVLQSTAAECGLALTRITIAHRPRTIANASRVVALEGGKVARDVREVREVRDVRAVCEVREGAAAATA
jgi:ABC-type bacteriocin/lantibiotic exporter with double-glycine peptidase domain